MSADLPPEPWHWTLAGDEEGKVTLRIAIATPANVDQDLRIGRPHRAAKVAEEIAEHGSESDVREVARMLARYLQSLAPPARPRRGRPTKDEEWEQAREEGRPSKALITMWKLGMAQRDLRVLLIARDIAAGREIGPKTISRMIFMLGYRVAGEPKELHIDKLLEQRAQRFADAAAAAEALAFLKPICEAELRAWKLHNKARQGGVSRLHEAVAARHGVKLYALKDVTEKTSE